MDALKTRRLGRTGLEVSQFGLGTYQITGDFGVPRAEALGLLDHAIRSGVSYMDTAPMYGAGESEELIGRATKKHPGLHVHVSTKVGHMPDTIVRKKGDEAYRDEASIRRVVEHSLHLLGRDTVEMVFVHEPEYDVWGFDYQTGDAVVTRTLEALKREGVIGAIGLGSNRWERALDLVKTGRFDVVELANQYNLVQRGIPKHIVPAAKKHDVAVIVGGPLKGGLFAVPNRARVKVLMEEGKAPFQMELSDLPKILQVYDLADKWAMSLPEMSIRFLLADPDIHSIIPGPRTVGEMDANVAAARKGPLPVDQVEKIEAIVRSGSTTMS